jgi:hypothetical protein
MGYVLSFTLSTASNTDSKANRSPLCDRICGAFNVEGSSKIAQASGFFLDVFSIFMLNNLSLGKDSCIIF